MVMGGPSQIRLLIDNADNIRIGTTTPEQKLHVAGNVKATQFIVGDVVFANGYVYFAESFMQISVIERNLRG